MAVEDQITVDRVSRWYGTQCAVNNISFSTGRGEILGFLGPNGAGKSTTMQMICGVLAAGDGTITIAGNDIVEAPTLAKRHLGYLPERPPLYLDLTVDEYLLYCARLRRIDAAQLDAAISAIKQRCGLEDAGRRLIGNLSQGFRQRVGIAQATIHAPSFVILDEPTVGLDPNQIIEIRELIRELGQEHSVILSTHILPEVQGLCDRIIIINQGCIVLDSPVAEINNLEQTFVELTRPATTDAGAAA